MEGIPMLILSVGGIILMLFFVTYASQRHNLNSIKDKTVGNGQHGTARWATQQEVRRTYHHVTFIPEQWRMEAREGKQPTANGKLLPQGIILGSKGLKTTIALVDSDDVHVLMIGASGVGKTAYFLYPNLEYACASGMSFLALDTKGDLARNYGAIARDTYGYRISVVDLREPTRSDGNNLLTLINRYMDKHRDNPRDIGAKAKAEKYAKILAKTIINPEGDNTDRGQNAYFYDSAEGLLASVVLLLSEFLPPEAAGGYELRHIASVFKLVQELLMESSSRQGGNQFQELMQLLPADHKAKWLAGSALTASDQGMNSIMSTVLSKLNAFLDTELEQVICFDGGIDAELFVRERCAIFLILPEEDATKNFVASLMIQNLARELFSVANEHGGRLPNRAVYFCDELGTMPPFDILPLFSAGRSRRLTLVPIIQSLAQLEKNYGMIDAQSGGDKEVREYIIAELRTAIRYYDLHDDQKNRIYLLKQAIRYSGLQHLIHRSRPVFSKGRTGLLCFLVLPHGVNHLLGGGLLCGRQSSPAFKQLLQLRCQLNHFTLCKELRKGDTIAAADCFQSGNRWNGIPAEDICNCCVAQSAPSG